MFDSPLLLSIRSRRLNPTMTQPSDPSNQPIEQPTELTHLRVWDLPVRIFHWLLVILFAAAYITHVLGTDYFIYHLWSGYAMLVLVSFRILWGFVGSYHARFSNFVRNPIATIKYAFSIFKKNDKHYAGHNPLGALITNNHLPHRQVKIFTV